jgi:hypothetical protein
MIGEKPVKPASLDTPGLIYRPRQSGWLLMWSPRSDLVARGYPKTTFRLWPPSAANPHPPEPTPAEWEAVSAWCVRYQAELLLWANGGVATDPNSIFDGTIGSLSKLYQTDPDSGFKNLRHKTSLSYASKLRAIEIAIGSIQVRAITFRDFKRWYDQFAAPDSDGEPERKSRAHSFMTMLRIIFAFGKLALPKSSGCADVCEILHEMEFAGGTRRRVEIVTYQHARLVIAEARRRGLHSIALAQAMMTECGLRQKDVLGEWVPTAEPGMTDVHTARYKWLMGARWEEVDANLVWRHRLSKSVKGKKAIMDAQAGKVEEFDLKVYPMVVEELQRFGDRLPPSGPIIINENTGRPWNEKMFQKHWRRIARACGIPDNVQNRDSRAGAATEAELAGAPEKTIQRLLGHSRSETTEIYMRGGREVRSAIAKLRVEKRKP